MDAAAPLATGGMASPLLLEVVENRDGKSGCGVREVQVRLRLETDYL
jgi:hypothetical protein